MLAYIQLLYEVEREARNATAEQRRELRQAKSLPTLEDIENYLQTEKPKVLPKSPMGVAIDYTLSNWEALLRYTEDGDLEIDNNARRTQSSPDRGGPAITGFSTEATKAGEPQPC